MAKGRILAFASALLFPLLVWADQLEVLHQTNIYSEPNRHSEALVQLDTKEKRPYLIRLLDDKKQNGYYRVSVPGKVKEGWIYKTYVRRFKGQHPAYQPYKRSLYLHWIDENGDCKNTRTEVLVRDAVGPLKYKTAEECEVLSGTWEDPYTGKTIRNPKELDVDHLVPLKNAHESGAWAWRPDRRQQYANYLKNSWHLLAVSLSENRKKGDKGPDRYLPPLAQYRCTYVKNWTKVKEEWELEMTEDEGMAVERILSVCPN